MRSFLLSLTLISALFIGSCGSGVGRPSDLSGNFHYGNGSGTPGITVTLTTASGTVLTETTDSNGNYTFPNIANGTYTMTPTKYGLTFTPLSETLTVSDNGITGTSFTFN